MTEPVDYNDKPWWAEDGFRSAAEAEAAYQHEAESAAEEHAAYAEMLEADNVWEARGEK